MKILLDACTPRPLRRFLSSHSVTTAQEMGWGGLKNGQQQVLGRKLAILLLPTNDWPTIRSKGAEISAKVGMLKSEDFVELDCSNP